MRRVVRRMRGIARRRSIADSRLLTAAGVRPSSRAAALRLPAEASVEKKVKSAAWIGSCIVLEAAGLGHLADLEMHVGLRQVDGLQGIKRVHEAHGKTGGTRGDLARCFARELEMGVR